MSDSQVSTRITTLPAKDGGEDAGDECVVVIYPEDNPNYGRRTPLFDGLSVGRGTENDLVFAADCVSRQHCRFELSERGWRVIDTNSKNGTFVDGASGVAASLRPGVLIKVGDTILKFLSGADIELQFLETVHRMAIEDPLTGLDNRRAFMQTLAREFPRAKRYRHPLTLAVLDTDHFKVINDDHGHASGDMVLQQLTALIRARLRAGDVFARLGGEEFAILFPETDVEAAARACEDIRVRVASSVFEGQRRKLPVTVSIGIAELGPGMSESEVLDLADARMYVAKNAGRNRVFAG